MPKWKVFLFQWSKVHGYDVQRLHFGPIAGVELLWEKALQEGLFEVYETEAESLDLLFTKLNVKHPADYTYRSMSVGDVAVDEAGKAWVVRGIGWEPISIPWKRFYKQSNLNSGGSRGKK